MHNSSVFVSDPVQKLYAVGYRHGGEAVTISEIIESAIAIKQDGEIITPRDFLAEWHRLNLSFWDHPSQATIQSIERHDEIANKDDYHFEVEMDNGRITSVRGMEKGKETFQLLFPQ